VTLRAGPRLVLAPGPMVLDLPGVLFELSLDLLLLGLQLTPPLLKIGRESTEGFVLETHGSTTLSLHGSRFGSHLD